MNWTRLGHDYVSDCGRYDIRGSYSDRHFAWRARHIATDELVCSSADRSFVEQCCERHAAAVDAQIVSEATA